MPYEPFLSPDLKLASDLDDRTFRSGDRTPKPVYVLDKKGETLVAVNAALATGRPILISGDPGTGKSSLARFLAEKLSARYYQHTISSRTEARDLLWTFDAVRRLGDAQAGAKHLKEDAEYLEPGALWWSFDRESALRRGKPEGSPESAVDPSRTTGSRAVCLLDEIDKADPDVPNNLLEPLGSLQFTPPSGVPVEASPPPLVLITTNRERELPQAFLRRCLTLHLDPPSRERLIEIGKLHFPGADDARTPDALFQEVADAVEEIGRGRSDSERPKPSTAEFLDAIGACVHLGLEPGTEEWTQHWKDLREVTLGKAAAEED